MTADQPCLIPQPRHWEMRSGSFALGAATMLSVAVDASDAKIFAARQLQQAIHNACGFTVPLRKGTVSQQDGLQVMLANDSEHVPVPITPDDVPLQPQGYHLSITPEGVDIAATDEAGVFYGVQTLIQLVRTHGRRLPACWCIDAPVLPHRGVMLDVSRGKVPTRATLEHLADVLAHYKINQLQLYTEHTFRFPSHPDIGVNCGSLDADDMLALDAVCRARHIELVPNLQSTGHMRHILSLPAYEHLAETPWRWSITPARDETYQLFDQLYADLLPAFSSHILNINSDETWDLGRGQAKALAADVGYGRVYLQHLLKLHALAVRHGRQIMMWADVLHHYPDLIAELPPDVTLLDWNYEAQPSYPTLDALARSGRPFYVCPGTSTWNTIFPRIDNAATNIRNYVRDGIAAGAIGMLLTDWGDGGHYQPLGHSWYTYVFGAEMAWAGDRTPTDTFDQAFGALFLGDTSGRAVAAIRRLGRAVEQPGLGFPNRSDTVYALYEEPLVGRMTHGTPPAVLAEMEAAAAAALPAWALLPDATLRHEWQFSAYQMLYAAQKVQWGQTIRATLHELTQQGAPSADGVARLDAQIAELARLRAALPAMVAEFEHLWLRQARRSEININIDRYAALMTRFDVALDWLHEQRDVYMDTGQIDAAYTTYDAGDYRVLWDESLHELRQLVDLVGPAAVPPEILQWLGLSTQSSATTSDTPDVAAA